MLLSSFFLLLFLLSVVLFVLTADSDVRRNHLKQAFLALPDSCFGFTPTTLLVRFSLTKSSFFPALADSY